MKQLLRILTGIVADGRWLGASLRWLGQSQGALTRPQFDEGRPGDAPADSCAHRGIAEALPQPPRRNRKSKIQNPKLKGLLIGVAFASALAAGAAAHAQPPAEATLSFGREVPRYGNPLRAAAGPGNPLRQASYQEPQLETDLPAPIDDSRPLESYLLAAPPPDPPYPQWGSLEQPVRQLPAMPTYNYLMAGPPRLIVEREWTQPIQRPVGDPAPIFADDQRLNMPIDLYRPDGLAPPGVTGDHTLKNSHALFSYRYSVEGFNGNLNGIHQQSAGGVLGQFPYAPRKMFKQQHLLLIEYAPTDDLTLMAQLPFQVNSIDYSTRSGGFHDAYTQVGDVSLWALYVLRRWQHHQVHANFGLNIPSNLFGGTLNLYPTPGFPNLSYPLRVGTGSYGLMPGLTYRGQSERWTWGMQAIVTIPLGYNRYEYEVGDRIDLNAWVWRRWGSRWATSGRLHGQGWGNIRHSDPRLNPNLAETTVPYLQGGTRLDLLFGANYYWPWTRVPGNWFSIESGFPIYQNLHGPQPRATWLLYGGWNMMW